MMNESCASSQHLYECGCEQLKTLQSIVSQLPGVYGSRYSGAGFGGAVVALVDRHFNAESAAKAVRRRYARAHAEFQPRLYICEIGNGARDLDDVAPIDVVK